jgi:hypothetical protein
MLWMSVRFGWGNTAAAAVVAILPFVVSTGAVTSGSVRTHHVDAPTMASISTATNNPR